MKADLIWNDHCDRKSHIQELKKHPTRSAAERRCDGRAERAHTHMPDFLRSGPPGGGQTSAPARCACLRLVLSFLKETSGVEELLGLSPSLYGSPKPVLGPLPKRTVFRRR